MPRRSAQREAGRGVQFEENNGNPMLIAAASGMLNPRYLGRSAP
jgi:hypothetical protein